MDPACTWCLTTSLEGRESILTRPLHSRAAQGFVPTCSEALYLEELGQWQAEGQRRVTFARGLGAGQARCPAPTAASLLSGPWSSQGLLHSLWSLSTID